MGLFGPGWKSTNNQKANASLDKVIESDPYSSQIEEIASTAPLPEIRLRMVRYYIQRGISGERKDFLLNRAKNDLEPLVRKELIQMFANDPERRIWRKGTYLYS